jgi:hypothetical protein
MLVLGNIMSEASGVPCRQSIDGQEQDKSCNTPSAELSFTDLQRFFYRIYTQLKQKLSPLTKLSAD